MGLPARGHLVKIHAIEVTDIIVLPNRQRREFDADKLLELAGSITENGLIHPIVIRQDDEGQMVLVAGERRLKAIEYAWEFGDNPDQEAEGINCGDHFFPKPLIPCLFMGEMDPVDAMEVEFEENVRRTDLTWQETAIARSKLMELRTAQAERDGQPQPTIASIVPEVSDAESIQSKYVEVRQDLILAKHLDNPEVAKATSRKEAFKALKRHEETLRNAEHGRQIGVTFNSSMHSLLRGNCIEVMPKLLPNTYDIILTDPPYGMGAEEFGDSGGSVKGSHRYDDSQKNWASLISQFAPQIYSLAKSNAHAYVFCDIDRFHELKLKMTAAGWKCFRTPIVWHNPTSMRAPWPEQGPQRKYQLILYAVKGDKPVTRLYGDVIQCPSDPNLGHAAQKPVALLLDLLQRSARPGDAVLDPFVGSGSIYPACHEAKCKATGIEMDESAYGLAAKRLEELK
jgi:DNA modification methylase/ParB-like chromosome segregation protein Spo0J